MKGLGFALFDHTCVEELCDFRVGQTDHIAQDRFGMFAKDGRAARGFARVMAKGHGRAGYAVTADAGLVELREHGVVERHILVLGHSLF